MMMIINESAEYITTSFPKENSKLTVLIADDFKKSMCQLIDEKQGNLILDLASISFIDSSGFGSLIAVFTHAKNQQAHLKLCNIKPMVMSLIKITKLDQVLEIYESIDDAIKSI
ncbi:MAG: STAS domain-containing protein [Salinivirgaceae bacterium]|jgi:anti-sigma B factor antagonist